MDDGKDFISAILVSAIIFFIMAGLTWIAFWGFGYESMWTWRMYSGIWSVIIILRYAFGKEKK